MAAGSGQENSFWLSFAAWGGVGGAAGGLGFKVIAPNLDTEATLVALLFLYVLLLQRQQAERTVSSSAGE